MESKRSNPVFSENGHRDVTARARKGAWRQRTAAHIAELQAQLDRYDTQVDLSSPNRKLVEKANVLLEAARDGVDDRADLLSWWSGSAVDRASANINEAELLILQLTPDEELAWRGAVVLAHGVHHLGNEDPRLKLLEEHLRENENTLDAGFRELAISVLHAANHVQETEIARARNFRDVLLVSFFVTSLIVAVFIWSGYVNPTAVADKLCFDPADPQRVGQTIHVCPVGKPVEPDDMQEVDDKAGGADVVLVALVGMCSATLTGAASVRHIRGTAGPYMVPLGLLLLRIPIGALSALIGLILIHGEFIPGLSALDNSAQIIAWAVAFGIGQEALTRMIDQQGNRVLENVRGSARGFDFPPPSPEPSSHVPRPTRWRRRMARKRRLRRRS
ncbi:hypothetical protein [Streptomyces spongiae]|uniref:Uncharacterized protein n=1 Tax=Streptomyces spongiae TaxID=565072 RepID=A0A5N8XCF3_9ACTN|nr:hypothetical protein [Streptomyces spongiae]MPY57132.1 hypothetical protein [Streptomyces spongiae]